MRIGPWGGDTVDVVGDVVEASIATWRCHRLDTRRQERHRVVRVRRVLWSGTGRAARVFRDHCWRHVREEGILRGKTSREGRRLASGAWTDADEPRAWARSPAYAELSFRQIRCSVRVKYETCLDAKRMTEREGGCRLATPRNVVLHRRSGEKIPGL